MHEQRAKSAPSAPPPALALVSHPAPLPSAPHHPQLSTKPWLGAAARSPRQLVGRAQECVRRSAPRAHGARQGCCCSSGARGQRLGCGACGGTAAAAAGGRRRAAGAADALQQQQQARRQEAAQAQQRRGGWGSGVKTGLERRVAARAAPSAHPPTRARPLPPAGARRAAHVAAAAAKAPAPRGAGASSPPGQPQHQHLSAAPDQGGAGERLLLLLGAAGGTAACLVHPPPHAFPAPSPRLPALSPHPQMWKELERAEEQRGAYRRPSTHAPQYRKPSLSADEYR